MLRTNKIRTGLATIALAAGLVAVGAAPAAAIPTLPSPSPSTLVVLTYYSGTSIVGQEWYGCPGVPWRSWGNIDAGRFSIGAQSCSGVPVPPSHPTFPPHPPSP